MNWWLVTAELIAKLGPQGLVLAQTLWTKWAAGGEPTQADWNELEKLAAQTPRSQLLDAFARNGIAVDSAHAIALLKLLPN